MLEYVFVNGKNDTIKVACSEAEGNLPDFSAIGISAKDYEDRLKQHYDYLAYKETERKKRAAYDDLFYGNIGLFLENYEKIVDEPKFANIYLPRHFYGFCYGRFGNERITLGELLRIYKNEPNFSCICPDCGGTAYITLFGLGLSMFWPTHRCCVCNKSHRDLVLRVRCSGHSLRNIRNNYSPATTTAPVTIFELLKTLGLDADESLACYNKQDSEPQDADVIVPQECWTVKFTVAVLKTGLRFGYIPARYNKIEFLEMICAEFGYVPNLGEMSPKRRTVSICIAAIKGKKEFHKNRLMKLVPEHLRDEVLKLL